MKFRNSVLAVSAVALLFGGMLAAEKVSRRAVEVQLKADGCDPVPLPYPRPTRGRALNTSKAAGSRHSTRAPAASA